jgi:hypothetical protein
MSWFIYNPGMSIRFQEGYLGSHIARTGFETNLSLAEFIKKYCNKCPVKSVLTPLNSGVPKQRLPLECFGMNEQNLAPIRVNENGQRYFDEFKKEAACKPQ